MVATVPAPLVVMILLMMPFQLKLFEFVLACQSAVKVFEVNTRIALTRRNYAWLGTCAAKVALYIGSDGSK